MNKEAPKMSKRYSKHPNFGMLAVINDVASDSNNRVGGQPPKMQVM